MPADRLTDVPGIRVGHWTDADAGTGCTVIIPPPGSIGAVDVRGGGPSTRELELLAPLAGDREVTALLLTGGSAFGLAAADGVMRWCEEQGLGIDAGAARIPVVPAAVIYDLGITANGRRPGSDEGYAACVAASTAPHEVGSVGAGTGATVGKVLGQRGWCKGGLGSASARLLDDATVAVLVVVNAFGDVFDERGEVLAGAWDVERGFVRAPTYVLEAPPEPAVVHVTTAPPRPFRPLRYRQAGRLPSLPPRLMCSPAEGTRSLVKSLPPPKSPPYR